MKLIELTGPFLKMQDCNVEKHLKMHHMIENDETAGIQHPVNTTVTCISSDAGGLHNYFINHFILGPHVFGCS